MLKFLHNNNNKQMDNKKGETCVHPNSRDDFYIYDILIENIDMIYL